MYITGDRGDSSLLINTIRTWNTPELMMKYLWDRFKIHIGQPNRYAEYPNTTFEEFLDQQTYRGLRVYFSPTNQDAKMKLLASPALIALAKELKYIQ